MSKPLLFALCGAGGCLIASLIGEVFLAIALPQGYYPETARIFQEGGAIIMEYDSEYGKIKGMKNLTHTLRKGATRKFGDVRIEVQKVVS